MASVDESASKALQRQSCNMICRAVGPKGILCTPLRRNKATKSSPTKVDAVLGLDAHKGNEFGFASLVDGNRLGNLTVIQDSVADWPRQWGRGGEEARSRRV